jgi:hypothetical protein
MQINLNNTPPPVAPGNPGRGKVVVSTHPVRERIMLDKDGNEVSSHDPRKKRIIRRAEDIK